MAANLTLDRAAMKNPATVHLRIYVGGLGDTTSIDDLYEQFIPFGQINGISVHRFFAFVQFQNEDSVHEAIQKSDGAIFQGKTLNVRPAQTNNDKSNVRDQDSGHAEVAIISEIPATNEEAEEYDSYGNYIGDKGYIEEQEEGYDRCSGREARGGVRGRAGRGGPRGRGRGAFRERSPAGGRGERNREARGIQKRRSDWTERGYDRFSQMRAEYPPRPVPVTEKNDCEIIVVSKILTEYAEYIEGRLKRLGIVVDLLFPMEDVPIGKVLGNIASRGCLYAILVMPQNQEHRSLTLTILHGLPQEHRNMPIEDALFLINRNFQEVQRGGSSGREAVYALLGQLADGQTLTVLQYDKVIEYLKERREQQVKIELGDSGSANSKTQVELQQRILSILNDKKAAEPSPAPVPAPVQNPPQNKLLNDPTVRKALDSILQKFV